MVEIPNQLNSLLRECRTATDIYERLRQKRCLSKPGEEHRAAAVASIDQGEAEWRREVDDPGACGGTREWFVLESWPSRWLPRRSRGGDAGVEALGHRGKHTIRRSQLGRINLTAEC
jgi:hypothetical protein